MAFSFRMTFTGLCAFVPRALQAGERPQGRVLLVNATTPVDDLNLHVVLNPHTPTIQFHGTKQEIRRQDVRVEFVRADGTPGSTTPAELVPVDLQIPNPKPPAPRPNTDDDRDHYWIMDMAALAAGPVANECFDPQPLLENIRVTSRVKLNAGFLSTSHMVEAENDGSDLLWAFRKSDTATTPATTRAIAAEFAVTALADADRVLLVLTSWDTGAEQRIPLDPVAGEVIVAVENLCGGDCEYLADDEGNIRVIADFGWFYRLAAVPAVLHLPYQEGGGLTDTVCPPARYPAHPNA